MWKNGNTLKLGSAGLKELKQNHGIDDDCWIIDADEHTIYVLKEGNVKIIPRSKAPVAHIIPPHSSSSPPIQESLISTLQGIFQGTQSLKENPRHPSTIPRHRPA